MKTRKVALIGTGAVGTSFLYSAINSGVAEEYVLIDLNSNFAFGHVLDLEDAKTYLSRPFTSIIVGTYEDLKDCDVIVITAGRPQRDGESRLDMVKDNARIMKEIATKVKNSGFKGITVIASNPVDVMSAVYQKITNYDACKVLSSGTSLDSSRLRVELSKQLNVTSRSIHAYVLGEHGDSSVSVFSQATIGSIPLKEFCKECNLSKKELHRIHETMWQKAYEIIKRKNVTHFGIGIALNTIVKAIIFNEKSILPVGTLLNGEYGEKGIYCGTPCVIGKDGISKVIELKLDKEENQMLKKSFTKLKEATKIAFMAIE